MKLNIPKKTPSDMHSKAVSVISRWKSGEVQAKKTKVNGMLSLRVQGQCRLVIDKQIAHLFLSHDKYEKFLDKK